MMAKKHLLPTRPSNGDESYPEERDSNRIRAFLSRVKPLSGCDVGDDYWEGRALIEQLGDEGYHWNAAQIAVVLDFMRGIEPVDGTCFCSDDSRINATCGFHAVIIFMADQVRILAPSRKRARVEREVANG